MLNPAPAARAVKPGVGARALYLGSREAKRVSCTAEALVVTNARAQTLRYPVARVARVISSADVVDWSGTALALCLRAGIGITWLDARGNALGSLYPRQRTTAPSPPRWSCGSRARTALPATTTGCAPGAWTSSCAGAKVGSAPSTPSSGRPPNANGSMPDSTHCTCHRACAACCWRKSPLSWGLSGWPPNCGDRKCKGLTWTKTCVNSCGPR